VEGWRMVQEGPWRSTGVCASVVARTGVQSWRGVVGSGRRALYFSARVWCLRAAELGCAAGVQRVVVQGWLGRDKG
jgi:hypothetical protein